MWEQKRHRLQTAARPVRGIYGVRFENPFPNEWERPQDCEARVMKQVMQLVKKHHHSSQKGVFSLRKFVVRPYEGQHQSVIACIDLDYGFAGERVWWHCLYHVSFSVENGYRLWSDFRARNSSQRP